MFASEVLKTDYYTPAVRSKMESPVILEKRIAAVCVKIKNKFRGTKILV